MTSAAYVAASGALIADRMLKAEAYNISNLNTLAFKEKILEVSNIVASNMTGPATGTQASDSGNKHASMVTNGLGVKIQGESTNLRQGDLKMTDGTYDLAIQGRGYFVLLTDDGQKVYTRAGNFKKSSDGRIVNQKGYALQPSITIPDQVTSIEINESGEVWLVLDNQPPQNLGQIEIATFSNPAGLQDIGDNLLIQADPNDNPVIGVAGKDGKGQILQGALEGSNVQAITSLVRVMDAQNAFGMLLKIIEADKKQGEQVVQAAS